MQHRLTLEGRVTLTLNTLLQVPKETVHSRGVGAGSSGRGGARKALS